MPEQNNDIIELKNKIDLMRNILAVFIDKTHVHGGADMIARLYNSDDKKEIKARLGDAYDILDLD